MELQICSVVHRGDKLPLEMGFATVRTVNYYVTDQVSRMKT